MNLSTLCSLDTDHPRYLEGMVRLYNIQTAGEPYIAPLTPDRFVDLVVAKSYFDPTGLFVALRDDEVSGWSTPARRPARNPGTSPSRKLT